MAAINEYKGGEEYEAAKIGRDYAQGDNTTIMEYRKFLHDANGVAVPDNYSANHKISSGFFGRFTTQLAAFLLGNGVSFERPEEKSRLGKNFDTQLYKLGRLALIQGRGFGFWNNDRLEIYSPLEFVPFEDEENGALMAGVRFWQIDGSRPLRATLFELDGYTDYIKRKGEDIEILTGKRPYRQILRSSEADGTWIYDGMNYPGFPVCPLWGNPDKTPELTAGRRGQIDAYDLIKSGFANDLDDVSQIFWILKNTGGMKEPDLVNFIQGIKRHRVANLPNWDEGSVAEPQTVEIPYQAREIYLTRLEKDLYRDFMALDVEQIAAGNITATQIQAAYEPMNQRADEFEYCVLDFLHNLFKIAGIKEENPTFKRSQIVNQNEQTLMVLSAAQYLDAETVLRKLPFLTEDEIEGVLERVAAEEIERYSLEEEENPEATGGENIE